MITDELKQPKFKFGDKVAHPHAAFKIDKIEWARGDKKSEYHYSGFILDGEGYDRASFPEDSLHRYEEKAKDVLIESVKVYGGIFNPRTRVWEMNLIYSSHPESDKYFKIERKQ